MMNSSARHPCHRSGSALIAVLWLVAILSMAAIVTLRVVSFDMEISTSRIHGFLAKLQAENGIAIGSNPGVKPDDPLLHHAGENGDAYDVRIIPEGARFNINALVLRGDKALLRSIFINWGLSQDDADTVADSLGDWIDSDDDVSLHGAEKDWYLQQGRINQPFNRPFYNLDEVRLVRGMDMVEAVRPDWRNWFTIWSGGKLDANEADAELIAAAAEVPVEDAQMVVDQVRGPDGVRNTEDDKPFQDIKEVLALLKVDTNMRPDIAQRFTLNDPAVRVESIGHSGDAKRKVTLVLRNRTGKPAVLERTEEIIP
jgi:type II secretory pathway component PulK